MVATRVPHEIKNPLNFVNNFSFLSGELVDDVISSTSDEDKKERGEMLKKDLSKIIENENRATLIIKQLLEHSNKGTTHEYFEK